MSKKFISVQEKMEAKNEALKELSNLSQKLKTFLPQDWNDKLANFIKEAKQLDENSLPKDDIINLKTWDVSSASYLDKKEVKEFLDSCFPYTSKEFSFKEVKIKDVIFSPESIYKKAAKEIGLDVKDISETVSFWELTRTTNNRSELWLMNIVMIPGYFFIFADCGRTDFETDFVKNEDMSQAFKDVANYVGYNLVQRDKDENGWQ